MDKEILIYCPKCSRQIVTVKSKLGESILCPHCGDAFVAKAPKRYSENKAQFTKIISILCLVIAYGIGKWVGPNLARMIFPKSQDQVSYDLSMKLIDEYSSHLRQYGKTLRESGILDIYTSDTGKELKGEIDSQKYRHCIEISLREAKELNAWCKVKLESFDVELFKGKSAATGKMIRDVYESYYELTCIGTNLFAKTLMCHKICCGSRKGASKSDENAYKVFCDRTKKQDMYGRKGKESCANTCLELKILCDSVYDLAREYAEVESKKMAKIKEMSEHIGATSSRE